MSARHRLLYQFCIAFAFLVIVAELGHYFWTLYTTGQGHTPNGWVMVVAAVIGMAGFNGIDAGAAGRWWSQVSGTGLQALEIVRSGRRRTDPVVARPTPAPVPAPPPPADPVPGVTPED